MTGPAPHVADPYRTLGVPRAATDAEIKAAHRKLAKRFHPDTDGGDTRRFLRIQEAYRVLSDPLLRREWDARHAPGPVRADRAEPVTRPSRSARPARSRATTTPPTAEPAESPPPPTDARREPRSSRAYTWSAGEVPWWEEGVKRDAKRRARQSAAPPPANAPADAANEFDVYNRSSGAAWSMAARAYFRRGDQELPRRGSFHHQGSQPLTAARARTAAEQDARRRAAAAAAAAASSTAQAAPPPQPAAAPRADAATARQSRDQIVRRSIAAAWPSLGQRLVFALVAWLPIAAAIALSSSARIDEVMQAAMLALSLGILAAVPRLAYVLAVATLGLLVLGFFLILGLAVIGVPLPLTMEVSAALGGALALGYVAIAGMVALGPAGLRPWSRDPEPARGR